MKLDRRGSGEQHALCSRPDLLKKGHDIVRLALFVDLFGPSFDPRHNAATGSVRFVHDHTGIAASEQLPHCLTRSAHYQSLGNQANPPRARAKRFGSVGWMLNIVLVHPGPTVPAGGRKEEEFHEFILPLPEQRVAVPEPEIDPPLGSSSAISMPAIANWTVFPSPT